MKTLRTNWALNPSYRATSGTTAVRTNLHPNPSFGAASVGTTWGYWSGTGGTSGGMTRASGSDTPRGTTGYGRVTWSVAPSSGGGATSGSNVTIAANTTYTVSVFVRPSAEVTMYTSVQFYNAGSPTGSFTGAVFTCPANQWTRIWATGTSAASDNQLQARFYVQGTGIVVGSTLDVVDCLIEATDTLQPYFDGSSKLNLLPQPQQANSNNGATNPAAVDPNVSHTGTLGSTRFDGIGTSSNIISSYGNGGVGSLGIAVTPGVTYTFSTWVLIKSTVAATGYIRLNWRNATTVFASVNSSTASIPVGSGWVQMSVTATAPDGAVTMYPTVAVGRVGGNTVIGEDFGWVADALLEASSSVGPFYRGLTPAWSGAANASPSVLNGTQPDVMVVASVYAPYLFTGWASGDESYCVWNPRMANGLLMLFSNTSLANTLAVPGEYWSGRCQARIVPGSSASDVTTVPRLYAYAANGAVGPVTPSGAVVLPKDGSWVDLLATADSPIPSTSSNVRWYVSVAGNPGGCIIEFRRFVTEKVPRAGVVAGPYFDGSTPNTEAFRYSWAGTAELSESVLTTVPRLLVNGTDIGSAAYNVTQRGARWTVASKRGDNQQLPGIHGSSFLAGKTYDENTIVLSMWIIGCMADGSMPKLNSLRRQVEMHADMLTRLFSADAPITLTQPRIDGDRVLVGEVKNSIDFTTMAGATRAEFAVEVVAADPFWYAIGSTAQTVVTPAAGTYRLTSFSDATAPLVKAVYEVTGPVQSPVLTNPVTGQYVKLTDNVAAGQKWVVDVANWTSTNAGVNAIGKTVHGGGATLLDLSADPLGPQIQLDGTAMTSATSVRVTARKAYLIA